jgi:ubiquitin-protein ligase
MSINQAYYELVIRRLESFRRLLANDIITPVRISMNYLDLAKREFILTITGVKSPIITPTGYSYGDTFRIKITVPDGFPEAIPVIKFERVIPFHPHVFRSGDICWGTYNVGQVSNPSLIVWVVNLLYYLEYNQHPAYQMNVLSPANVMARDAYQQQRDIIVRGISPTHMERVVRCATDAENVR